MEILLLLVLIVAAFAIFGAVGPRRYVRRPPSRRVVSETVYEDEPVIVEEVEEVVERAPRRRVIEY